MKSSFYQTKILDQEALNYKAMKEEQYELNLDPNWFSVIPKLKCFLVVIDPYCN